MKNLAFIVGSMLTCCFCAEAQTQYTESFVGYDGFGTFNETASTAGTLIYSTPPQTPFSAVISGTSFTSGGTVNTSPNLFVTGSVAASPFSTVTLNGTAEVTYDVILVGPAGNQSVFLTGFLNGNVTAFENTTPPIYGETASSSITISAGGTKIYSATGSTSDSSPAPYQTPINAQAITLTSETVYAVQLLASVNLSGTISPGSTATASGTAEVDPYFNLTPAEISEGYMLEFSPGISNVPVPEPTDWVLFLGGAGFLVFFTRRTPVKEGI